MEKQSMILETVEEEPLQNTPDKVAKDFNSYLSKLPDISYKEMPPNPKVEANMKFLNEFRGFSRSVTANTINKP